MRIVWALVVFALIVVPALDLASGEPVHDTARCPVHANPGLAPVTACGAVAVTVPMLLLLDPLARIPLLSPSIFVPPRA